MRLLAPDYIHSGLAIMLMRITFTLWTRSLTTERENDET
jgi:hypothetical protein